METDNISQPSKINSSNTILYRFQDIYLALNKYGDIFFQRGIIHKGLHYGYYKETEDSLTLYIPSIKAKIKFAKDINCLISPVGEIGIFTDDPFDYKQLLSSLDTLMEKDF